MGKRLIFLLLVPVRSAVANTGAPQAAFDVGTTIGSIAANDLSGLVNEVPE